MSLADEIRITTPLLVGIPILTVILCPTIVMQLCLLSCSVKLIEALYACFVSCVTSLDASLRRCIHTEDTQNARDEDSRLQQAKRLGENANEHYVENFRDR
ncbi:hypothetical protein BJ508DRAFT_49485 [Ascobolus immersus RN42]|uniref:Uncharacterized protein n=1 Tax=Ascobolus immersus RN42 TaxID=1160509 RepID=A0A3N4HN16_ASCIM|nr:hypothetical protein BJ508DRAFT_49485 [Ascobolus immersus RN42]